MARQIVFDSEATPQGWFDPELAWFDREIPDIVVPVDNINLPVERARIVIAGRALSQTLTFATDRGRIRIVGRDVALNATANLSLAVARNQLRIAGRDITLALTASLSLPVTRTSLRIAGRDVSLAVTANVSLPVVRTSLRIAGRLIPITTGLNVQRAAVRIAGRDIGLAISASVGLAIERTRIRIAGRDVAINVPLVLPIERSRLQITGRDVGIFPTVNLPLAVERGRIQVAGRQPTFALGLAVERQTLRIAGREIDLEIVGHFSMVVARAQLLITGREIGLEIRAPVAPPVGIGGGFDPVTMGRLGRQPRRGLPNVRFIPPRAKEKSKDIKSPETERFIAPVAPAASKLLRALVQRIELPPAPPPVATPGDAAETRARVRIERHEAATSPTNERALPTEPQKQAGNYPKSHIHILGFDITIENPVGSVREGPGWSVTMTNDYGYIRGTDGADEAQIDVFLGPHLVPECPVFVIDQIDPATRHFDEHKVILGARDGDEAEQIYDRNHDGDVGPAMRRATVRMSLVQFKQWLEGDTTEPAVDTVPPPSPEDLLAEERAKLNAVIADLRDEFDLEMDRVRGELERERAQRIELERAAAEMRRRTANRAAIDVALRALLEGD